MKSKSYIVSLGYDHFAVNHKDLAMNMLTEVVPVQREYVKGSNSYIYTPKDSELSITVVDSDTIRPMTEEESDKKELASAQSSAEYYKNANKDLTKQIEELKCQIKVLTKSEEV